MLTENWESSCEFKWSMVMSGKHFMLPANEPILSLA
jgi:hypothetical protein